MIMKNIRTLILVFAIGTHLALVAQNSQGKTDDAGRIPIKAFVPSDLGDITPKAQKALLSRLERIITKNGIGASSYDNRFILTAKINELSKDFVSGNPPVYNYELEVTLMIGDAIEGTLFSSYVIDVKGAGNTETSAYLAAIKRIKDQDSKYQNFIDESKAKIIEYYNSKCDFYLKEAQTLTAQSEYEAAIATLTSIPDVCKECYDKAMDAIAPIYQQQIDKQCKIDLLEAKNAWSISQDGQGADIASSYLVRIDPNSICFDEANILSNQIAERIKEIDKREWNFKMKQQQDDVDIQKARIKAARDVGVAYGENQPKSVTYNYRGWW